MPTLKVPKNTPAREALRLEQQHADAFNIGRKQWERCLRHCMQVCCAPFNVYLLTCSQIDARQDSLGTGDSASQPSNEQAALQRAKKKETVRNGAKDARNAHFQELVDKDSEVRSSLVATMEARNATADRMGRVFEVLAMAMMSKSLGPAAVPLLAQIFPAAHPAAAPAPAPAPEN